MISFYAKISCKHKNNHNSMQKNDLDNNDQQNKKTFVLCVFDMFSRLIQFVRVRCHFHSNELFQFLIMSEITSIHWLDIIWTNAIWPAQFVTSTK